MVEGGWWTALRLTREESILLWLPLFIVPLCVDALGAWGSSARELIRRIESCIMERTGEVHTTQFLIQQVAIQ